MLIKATVRRLVLLAVAAHAIPLNSSGAAQPAGSDGENTTSGLRIVSLNGGATEVLFALGAGPQLVGRDDSSYFPAQALEIPSVGYQFMLNSEALMSLRPGLVIGRADAKPESALSRLREAGVTLLLRPEPTTFDQARDRILELGKAVAREEQAGRLVRDLDKDAAEVAALIAARKNSARKPVKAAALYVRGATTALILGSKSGPASMLELAGADNVFKSLDTSKPLTPEALAAAAPEVIVVMREGVRSAGGVDAFLAKPAVAAAPAGKARRLVIMDDLYLGGFGPRTGKAALELHKGLYEATGVYEADGDSTPPDHETTGTVHGKP